MRCRSWPSRLLHLFRQKLHVVSLYHGLSVANATSQSLICAPSLATVRQFTASNSKAGELRQSPANLFRLCGLPLHPFLRAFTSFSVWRVLSQGDYV
jgi:hypothetical protein